MQRIVAIDSQELNEMQSCWRKYKLYHLERQRPVTTPDYFEKGTMLHRMLRAFYVLKKYRMNWQSNHRTYADVVDSCIRIGRHFAVKMSLDVDEVQETINAFREYCTHYANDGWDRILFAEQPACKVLYQDSELVILYEGIIDLIISIPNCPVLPVDHKSSKRRGRPHDLSNQFIGYCWLLGVNNLVVNKVGFQKTLKPGEKFERHTMSYTDSLIREWHDETVWWVRESLRMYADDFYPANKTSCDKYAGCVFTEVCKADPITRDWKLRTLFEKVDRHWSVGAEEL